MRQLTVAGGAQEYATYPLLTAVDIGEPGPPAGFRDRRAFRDRRKLPGKVVRGRLVQRDGQDQGGHEEYRCR
jgi:hypothetical protein